MAEYTIIDGVAYPIAASGATPSVAVSAPARPVIASPFTAAKVAAAKVANVATRAIANHPGDRRGARIEVAMSQEPLFTCTVDTVATLADGSTVPTALHGFLTPYAAGAPCTGTFGIAKGESCPGVIRG